jgi:hypothetical protein
MRRHHQGNPPKEIDPLRAQPEEWRPTPILRRLSRGRICPGFRFSKNSDPSAAEDVRPILAAVSLPPEPKSYLGRSRPSHVGRTPEAVGRRGSVNFDYRLNNPRVLLTVVKKYRSLRLWPSGTDI